MNCDKVVLILKAANFIYKQTTVKGSCEKVVACTYELVVLCKIYNPACSKNG